MVTEQTKQLDQINQMHTKLSNLTTDYWQSFSHIGTWQFWFMLSLLIFPLVALYFLLDRKKAFHIGFFGFNIHVWLNYFDTFGVTHGLWNYQYKVVPFLPISVALDTALVPVSFMLMYQWTLNRNKNYYLYLTGLSLFFSFLVKPAFVAFGIFKFYKETNFLHLFLGYITIMLVSKLITNIFMYLQKTETASTEQTEVKTFKRRSFLSKLFHFKQKAK
ncbi:CBO0543 family protein [Ammoniphilus sp. 3BR4]|uniref:CBO0543 family protein n=1 Tax=Ammoniphilus sp. 3BR4 TaxID=3158265 RepID=UPI003466FC3D